MLGSSFQLWERLSTCLVLLRGNIAIELDFDNSVIFRIHTFTRKSFDVRNYPSFGLLFDRQLHMCLSSYIFRRFVMQIAWTIHRIEFTFEVSVFFGISSNDLNCFWCSTVFIFWKHRNRFLNENTLKMSAMIRKEGSINTIKFIGRQHSSLTSTTDQLNFCYSYQVCLTFY